MADIVKSHEHTWYLPAKRGISSKILGKIFTLIPKSQRKDWILEPWVDGHMLLVMREKKLNGVPHVMVRSVTSTIEDGTDPKYYLPLPHEYPFVLNGIQLRLRNWTFSDKSPQEGVGLSRRCYIRCDDFEWLPRDFLLDTIGNDGKTMEITDQSWYDLCHYTATDEDRTRNDKIVMQLLDTFQKNGLDAYKKLRAFKIVNS